LNLNFKSFVTGNWLQTIDNRLHVQNSNLKPFLIAISLTCLLVIDYSVWSSITKALHVLESFCFETRFDLKVILKQGFVCWSNLVLILKQCLSFEAALFDSSLASSKFMYSYIYNKFDRIYDMIRKKICEKIYVNNCVKECKDWVWSITCYRFYFILLDLIYLKV